MACYIEHIGGYFQCPWVITGWSCIIYVLLKVRQPPGHIVKMFTKINEIWHQNYINQENVCKLNQKSQDHWECIHVKFLNLTFFSKDYIVFFSQIVLLYIFHLCYTVCYVSDDKPEVIFRGQWFVWMFINGVEQTWVPLSLHILDNVNLPLFLRYWTSSSPTVRLLTDNMIILTWKISYARERLGYAEIGWGIDLHDSDLLLSRNASVVTKNIATLYISK